VRSRRQRAALRVVAPLVVAAAALTCGGPPRPAPPPPTAVEASASADAAPDATIDATDLDAAREEPSARFSALTAPIERAIAESKLPGCVVVVGRSDEILLRRAFGSRAVEPEREPMTEDTIFDLASLTKAVATGASVMVLVDRGKVRLDAPASRYLPELAKLPPFTVEQMMLHTSGLPAVARISDHRAGMGALLAKVAETGLKARPGERFLYSDTGYILLAEIVRRASGADIATFAPREIYGPLGMQHTRFSPPSEDRADIAPTQKRDGGFMRGEVHDPRAHALGGVAGHAGLFSTADDLARFAQAMLGRGALGKTRVVSERTFDAWTRRRDTPSGGRALGWDVDSRFATHRSPSLSPRAFGHGGYTGTALWIDPTRDLFFLFLSNRVHPDGTGAVNPLVAELATLAVADTDTSTGIDVLRAQAFAPLAGARVALLTNGQARARDGTTTIELLRRAEGVTLASVFAPEHGLSARAEGRVADGKLDEIPVYGLYGSRTAPPDATLDGLDAIVVDLQDVGVRFYTYASTLKRVMEAAWRRGLRVVVLDRPDPLGGDVVDGPVLAPGARSFVHHHELPIVHGMTMGELARMFAAEEGWTAPPPDGGAPGLRLEIVAMRGWRRADPFERTGLTWSAPSPNLASIDAVRLYPAIGLLEGTNLSVGRGTPTPFAVVGAPWVDAAALTAALRRAAIPGVSFAPTHFTPTVLPFAKTPCHGVSVRVTDRAAYRPLRTGLAIARAIAAVHPTDFEVRRVDRMLQSPATMAALVAGEPLDAIVARWEPELARFRARRAPFLLYPTAGR
jgi:uncharacterized protein YbbC (DUF1343 family)